MVFPVVLVVVIIVVVVSLVGYGCGAVVALVTVVVLVMVVALVTVVALLVVISVDSFVVVALLVVLVVTLFVVMGVESFVVEKLGKGPGAVGKSIVGNPKKMQFEVKEFFWFWSKRCARNGHENLFYTCNNIISLNF